MHANETGICGINWGRVCAAFNFLCVASLVIGNGLNDTVEILWIGAIDIIIFNASRDARAERLWNCFSVSVLCTCGVSRVKGSK